MHYENIESNYVCRICLEYDHPSNMIYPCKCSGSSKYVHRDCLNQWIALSQNIDAKKRCFECNYEYSILENTYTPSFFSKFCKFLSLNLFLFLFFNFCIILLFSQLLLLDNNYTLVKLITNDLSKYNIIYYNLIWSDIFYALILILIAFLNFVFFVKNKKLYIKHCFYKKTFIIITTLLYLSIIFYLDFFAGFIPFTLITQIIIKYHFMFIETIVENNRIYILNYKSE